MVQNSCGTWSCCCCLGSSIRGRWLKHFPLQSVLRTRGAAHVTLFVWAQISVAVIIRVLQTKVQVQLGAAAFSGRVLWHTRNLKEGTDTRISFITVVCRMLCYLSGKENVVLTTRKIETDVGRVQKNLMGSFPSYLAQGKMSLAQ